MTVFVTHQHTALSFFPGLGARVSP